MITEYSSFETKFGVVEGNDDLVYKRTKNAKEGKKCGKKDIEPEDIPVVEVYTVDLETKKSEIRGAAASELKQLNGLIKEMDTSTDIGKQAVGMLRAKIA